MLCLVRSIVWQFIHAFKPPGRAKHAKQLVYSKIKWKCPVFHIVFVRRLVLNKDTTDRAEIFTEASPNALTPSKLGGTWYDSDSSHADSKFDDPDDSDQTADDFQSFFGQMNAKCDVDYAQTVLNIVRFLGSTESAVE